MKTFFSLLFSMLVCHVACGNMGIYVGSTPAHAVVRDFLQISSTDSIDFIRWRLEIGSGVFRLQCQYGLSKPGTPGFSNEQSVAFEGPLTQSENYYYLQHNGKTISLLEVNANVLHFIDLNSHMLIGNGGYSYALNSIHPVEVEGYNIQAEQSSIQRPLVFEGRTPCQDLATHLGLDKNQACNKMKWYFIFNTDSVTNKPSSFLMGGMGYRKETMARGRWEITAGPKRTHYLPAAFG